MQCVCLNHAVCLSVAFICPLSFFFRRRNRAFFPVAPLDWAQGPWCGQHEAGSLDLTQPRRARPEVPGAQRHAGVTFLSPALSTCYLVQDEGSLEKRGREARVTASPSPAEPAPKGTSDLLEIPLSSGDTCRGPCARGAQ